MKSLAALTLFVSVVSLATSAFADESWLEGRWIRDEDASIESITDGHPYMLACHTGKSADGASITDCTTLRERHRELREGEPTREWVFDAETAASLADGVVQARSIYTIYAVEAGKFELQLNEGGVQLTSVVQKTRSGFCMTPFRSDSSASSGEKYVDCYKHSGNRQLAAENMPSLEDMPVMKVALTQDYTIVVDGVAMGTAEFRRALAQLKAAHGSVIYYREPAPEEPTGADLEVNSILSSAHVPLTISTEADFSTIVLFDGTVGNRQ